MQITTSLTTVLSTMPQYYYRHTISKIYSNIYYIYHWYNILFSHSLIASISIVFRQVWLQVTLAHASLSSAVSWAVRFEILTSYDHEEAGIIDCTEVGEMCLHWFQAGGSRWLHRDLLLMVRKVMLSIYLR